jgi:hypothetical protein
MRSENGRLGRLHRAVEIDGFLTVQGLFLQGGPGAPAFP